MIAEKRLEATKKFATSFQNYLKFIIKTFDCGLIRGKKVAVVDQISNSDAANSQLLELAAKFRPRETSKKRRSSIPFVGDSLLF